MIQEFMIISARGDTLLTKNYAGSAVVLRVCACARVSLRAFLCLGTLVNSTAFGMLAVDASVGLQRLPARGVGHV